MTLSEFSDLELFAKRCIAADRYPSDYHSFRLFECDDCGIMAFKVAVEHHTGSKEGDFKGVIWGECAECGDKKRLFSFTGEHRKRLCEEKPVCECGYESFVVGECERIERDEGIAGFFDEGVVVGKCGRCERNRVFVHTD
jgi:hypothetical protein